MNVVVSNKYALDDNTGSPLLTGLCATFYDDPYLLGAVSSRPLTAQTVDLTTVAASLTNLDTFSVRWAGYVQPYAAGTWTFSAVVSQNDERIRLWGRTFAPSRPLFSLCLRWKR